MTELEPFKAAGCLTPLFNYVEATVRKDAQQARAAGRKSTRGQYAQAFVPVSVAN
jgi:hypothetical protein